MTNEVATRRTLWEQLSDETTPAGARFMSRYNALNERLGHSLGQLREQPQTIQGRDREIALLHAILERPKTPVALLLGHAGVGKTALVEEFAKQLNSGEYETHVEYRYLLVTLRLGTLASLGKDRLQTQLSTLLDDMAKLEQVAQIALNDPRIRIVLFMDEMHMLVTIFGAGTKVGGDVMKDALARSPIRVITATTRREYDSTIAVDKPLSERFKQIEMHELPPDVVVEIAKDWWAKVAPDCPPVDEPVIRKIIEANAMYRADSAEPRKSLDILEDLVSYSRRTGKKAGAEQVDEIFKRRYSISLKFEVDADDVYAEIERRIHGQPHALMVMRRLLRAMVFQLDATNNRPMATALFTGPTGVGKTETTKAIAHALYPGEPVLLNMNMPDFKTVADEARFRKILGEFVRHTPNAIVLLDELEKSVEAVKDSLLAILDEGIVRFETVNREGVPETNFVSLRNTIVIATTNAGSEVFDDDAKFSQREVNMSGGNIHAEAAEVDQLMHALRENLIMNGWKPELLGRFNRIVPFRSLSSDILVKITESALSALFKKFEVQRGIKIETDDPVQWPEDTWNQYTTDVAVYVAFVKNNATNSKAGGARAVKREIDSAITDSIVDAVMENPHCKHFHIGVSRDNQVYTRGAMASRGGIVVEPLD